MEPKWEPKSGKNQKNPYKNEVQKSMRKKEAQRILRNYAGGPKDNLISTRFPSEVSYTGTYLRKKTYCVETNILRRLFPWKNPSGGTFLEEKSRRKFLEEKS